MKYLIVKYEACNDQYECDANRTPMFLTDNYEKEKLDYDFEVYEIQSDNSLKLLEIEIDEGMIYGYFTTEDDEFHEIERFGNRTRYDSIPPHIKKIMKKMKDFDNDLKNCGIASGSIGEKFYLYTEYQGNHITTY